MDEARAPENAEIEGAGAGGITFDAAVPPPLQAALRRLHQNLGHIPNQELARHIKLSGGSQEAIKAAKSLRCRACKACARPQSARPAKPVPVLDFGDVLGIDVVHLVDGAGAKHLALSMIDYASTYHVVARVKDAKAKTLAAAVRDYWIAWAGPPRTFSLDLDSGFKNVFEDMCYDIGAYMSHSAGTAHWQHGLVERHNGVWKDIWDKLVESEAVTESEVAWAMAEVSNAKNQLCNKDGYAPRQWVFGVNPKLPGDVVDGASDLSALSSFSIDSKLQRQNAIRQAARIAFLQVQTSEAVQRALAHKSRVRKYNFEPGDLVYVFRERRPTVKGKRAQKQWLGPCTVVGTEGQNFWVSKGGRCLLRAPGQRSELRPWQRNARRPRRSGSARRRPRRQAGRSNWRRRSHGAPLPQPTGPPSLRPSENNGKSTWTFVL